ncbi:MAG: chromosome segregation protein SMC [Fusobacteriaceae bacterium]
MHLKAVEIYGFKSFGEKIYIEFGKGITSIVGPNGSGKSNIMDAVLWVLGEQSYKNIRAKDSNDVIFSGTGKKNSCAEVSLFIDNTDRYLEIDKDIIKITRKIVKSGENEYSINDSKSRLKDISSMFLDTGIGKSAYSVIGQGKVERIISSSSKEIKWIIEEAAGIKKFQIKKQESLKNLKNLQDELEKISLVMNQIEESKDHIEKQAGKAQEFIDLKTEKEFIEKGILTLEIKKKNSVLNETSESNIVVVEEIEKLEFNLDNDNKLFENNEKEKQELEKITDENIDKNKNLKEEMELSEREKARISERIESFKREVKGKLELEKQIIQKIYAQEEQDKIFNCEILEIEEKIKLLEVKNIEFNDSINSLEKEKKSKDRTQEIDKRKLMDFEVEKLRYVNEIENSARRAKTSKSKIEKLKEELEEFQKKESILEKNIEEITIKQKNQENKINGTRDRAKFLENKISTSSEEINNISEKIRENEYEEKRGKLKQQNLMRLEESNEGLFKGVKEVLNNKIPGVYGIVASLINIPEKLEKAIEAAIPGNFQDIVVDTTETANKGIKILKEKKAGRASFLALDTIKIKISKQQWKQEKGVLGLASNLVDSDEKYKKIVEFLLGNLLVVESLEVGMKILKSEIHNGNVVTLTGELLSSRGRITGGETQNSTLSQILERKKEKKHLEINLEKIKITLEKYNEEIIKYREELDKYEEEIYKIDTLEEEEKKELKKINEDLEDKKIKKERIERDLFILNSEYLEETNYITEFNNRIENSKEEKESTETKIINLKEEISKLSEDLIMFDEKIRIKKEEYSDIRILYMNSLNKKEQLELNKNKLSQENKENKRSLSENTARILEINMAMEKGQTKINEVIDEINKRMNFYESGNEILSRMKQRIIELTKEEKDLRGKIRIAEINLEKLRDKKIKQKEIIEKIIFEINNIDEKLTTLKDVELKDISEENYQSTKNKFIIIENKVKNFETVNLLAIEEFKILKNKFEFLKKQFDDMEGSKKNLLKLLDEISVEIENRFKDAYTAIDSNFNEMCKDILQNSEGKLQLVEGGKLEESGIDIMVRFKNKKQQSLSLFSGGEKSMVAIAFIMAIFQYKPSPFTFLDEIEAALDDKNTRKLIGKLKEFTDKSQFILITHNKETMRESDTIFGVTMNKEIGISKIVPVKF